MSKDYPYKCWCGVTIESKWENIEHDCGSWENIVAEAEKNER